jgi:hypothetical protein
MEGGEGAGSMWQHDRPGADVFIYAGSARQGQAAPQPERAGGPHGADGHGEREERFLDAFRERMITLHTLFPKSLRVLFWLVVGQLLFGGLLIALHNLPQPAITIDSGKSPIQLPAVTFAVSAISLVLAWSLLLTAALHGRWYLRLPLLGGFTLFALYDTFAEYDTTLDRAIRGEVTLGILVQVVLLAVLWSWGLVTWLLGRRAARRGMDSIQGSRRIYGLTLGFVFVLLVTHYVLTLTLADATGHRGDFSSLIYFQAFILYFMLIPVFFLTGTDFAEVAETLAGRVVYLTRRSRSPWPLAIITLVAALAILVRSLIDLQPPATLHHRISFTAGFLLILTVVMLVLGAFFAAAIMGGTTLVIRLGQLDRWERQRLRMPFWGYIPATLVLGVALIAIVALGSNLVFALVGPPLIGLAVGVPLVALGRTRARSLAITGVFLIALGFVGFLLFPDPQFEVFGISLIELFIAPATISILLLLMIRGQIRPEYTDFIAALLVLNVGIQVIVWIFSAFEGASQLGAQFTILQGVLLILAQFWDLIMSGELVTNIEGRAFPRYVRVLLYLGYILMVSTFVLYFSSQTYQTTGKSAAPLDDDAISRYGLMMLGVPLLMTNFVLAVGRWRRQRWMAQQVAQGVPLGVWGPQSRPLFGAPQPPSQPYPYPYPYPYPAPVPASYPLPPAAYGVPAQPSQPPRYSPAPGVAPAPNSQPRWPAQGQLAPNSRPQWTGYAAPPSRPGWGQQPYPPQPPAASHQLPPDGGYPQPPFEHR